MKAQRGWQHSAVLGAAEALRFAPIRCADALRAAWTAPARGALVQLRSMGGRVRRYAGQSRSWWSRGGFRGSGIRMPEQQRKIIAMRALTS